GAARGAAAPPPPARGRAPARADEAPGARAERAGESALGLRSEAVGRRADRPLGIAGLDREHAKGLVTRHERRTDYARRFRQPRTEPGSGWHGLPRRVETERPKEVAKIVDLLGAGEKFPQHHGTPGSETATLCHTPPQVGTRALRRQSKPRGQEARDEARERPGKGEGRKGPVKSRGRGKGTCNPVLL